MPPDASEPMVQHFIEKAEHDLRAAGLREACAALADYGVAPRYPGWELETGRMDPGEALEAARRGVELLRALLGVPPGR